MTHTLATVTKWSRTELPTEPIDWKLVANDSIIGWLEGRQDAFWTDITKLGKLAVTFELASALEKTNQPPK